MEDTIPSISGIGIAPEGDEDFSSGPQPAGGQSAAEKVFNSERQRVAEAEEKEKLLTDDAEEIENDPFDRSRSQANPSAPDKNNYNKDKE